MDSKRITSLNTDWETIGVAIILMATGVILIGGDLLGLLSLDRIQNLWPASLILIGMIDLLGHSGQLRRASPVVIDKETHAGQLR